MFRGPVCTVCVFVAIVALKVGAWCCRGSNTAGALSAYVPLLRRLVG
jgi:hypothetical protein